MTPTTPHASDDEARQLADRDRATRQALFGADETLVAIDRRLPVAVRDRLAVTAALGYLIGHGLITVKPATEWPEWVPLDIPEHLRPDLAGGDD